MRSGVSWSKAWRLALICALTGSTREGIADCVNWVYRAVVCWERSERSERVERMRGREERRE